MISESIISLLERESAFFNSGYHGFNHWQTVERNGLYLAQFTSADPQVVSTFAYLHDCMRKNESIDPGHGPRGMKYAKENRVILGLSDPQLEILYKAISGHTHGRQTDCITTATCWDADRLDIGRVGITPRAKFMFSDEAKRIADVGDFGVLGLT